jgi:hypothetical protein
MVHIKIPFIDQIDDIFAELFGFTEKEEDFIRNFDLEFRIESTNFEE